MEPKSDPHRSEASESTKAESDGRHRAWTTFMQYCRELRHGEIERLYIQDGLPVLAEVTKKKVKFT